MYFFIYILYIQVYMSYSTSCHVSNDLLGRGLCSLSAFLFVIAMKEVVKKKKKGLLMSQS